MDSLYGKIVNHVNHFQEGVWEWLVKCFGTENALELEERNRRFLEEALELVQACGMTKEETEWMIDYVYNRPEGEIKQEVGGVATTLAALCAARNISLGDAATEELSRIQSKISKIREKQKAKPVYQVADPKILKASEVKELGLYWFREVGSNGKWYYMDIERNDEHTFGSGFLDRFEFVRINEPKL